MSQGVRGPGRGLSAGLHQALNQLQRAGTLALAVSALGGCTYSVHQASVGGLDELPAGVRVRAIEAHASEDFVLGLGGDTAYVDSAWKQLQDQCRGGQIVGVESRHSSSLSFLSSEDHIKLTGLCYERSNQPSVVPDLPPGLPPAASAAPADEVPEAAAPPPVIRMPSGGPVVAVEP